MWQSHRFWRKSKAPELQDGFGQSMLDDAKFAIRFRKARGRVVHWRAPSNGEREHFDIHATWGRFGDSTIALANIDGRNWIVRERDWYGWPDPPQYVFIALRSDGTVWCAWDFHNWPQEWAKDS